MPGTVALAPDGFSVFHANFSSAAGIREPSPILPDAHHEHIRGQIGFPFEVNRLDARAAAHIRHRRRGVRGLHQPGGEVVAPGLLGQRPGALEIGLRRGIRRGLRNAGYGHQPDQTQNNQ